MLSDFPLNAVLPAKDGARARAFYRDVLGLELLSAPDADPMMFLAGKGTTIVVTEITGRTPPPYPVVSFLVEGIEELVKELRGRGAKFQALPGSSTFGGERGVPHGAIMDFGAVKTAFVKDTEGNLLALNELVEDAGGGEK